MYLEKLNKLLGSTPVIKVREFGEDEENNKLYRAETTVNNKPFAARHKDCAQAIENCAMLACRELEPYDPFEEAVWGNE